MMEEPSGERTLVVRLISRATQETLWYGSVDIPAPKPGHIVPAEEWIKRLLAPLSNRT